MSKVDSSYRVDQLKDIARTRKLNGYSKLRKNELIELINNSIVVDEKWEQLKKEVNDSKYTDEDYEVLYETSEKNIKDLNEELVEKGNKYFLLYKDPIASDILNLLSKTENNIRQTFKIGIHAFYMIYIGINNIYEKLIISKNIEDLKDNIKKISVNLFDYVIPRFFKKSSGTIKSIVTEIIDFIISDILELCINSAREYDSNILSYIDIQRVAYNDYLLKDIFEYQLIPDKYWSIRTEYLPKKQGDSNKFWEDMNIKKILDLYNLKASNNQIAFLKRYTVENYYSSKAKTLNISFEDYLHNLILNISDKIEGNTTYYDFVGAVLNNTFVKSYK
jgi:hypothetical protein